MRRTRGDTLSDRQRKLWMFGHKLGQSSARFVERLDAHYFLTINHLSAPSLSHAVVPLGLWRNKVAFIERLELRHEILPDLSFHDLPSLVPPGDNRF